jgi:hypothetical protein
MAMNRRSIPQKNVLIWTLEAGTLAFFTTADVIVRGGAIQIFAQESFVVGSLHKVRWTCE